MTFQHGIGAAIPPRPGSKSGLASQVLSPPQPPLPPTLERLFGLIAEPVRKLEAAPEGPLTLREIGLLLGDVLDWLGGGIRPSSKRRIGSMTRPSRSTMPGRGELRARASRIAP